MFENKQIGMEEVILKRDNRKNWFTLQRR